MAWFHSAPVAKHEEKKSVSKVEIDKDRPLTRGERIEKNGGNPLMPEIGKAAYLVKYWQDAGMVCSGGMSAAPISSTELMAWQQGSGIYLQPWEFSVLLDMSRVYLSQAKESEKLECPPPFGDPVNEFDRGVVSKKVANAFKAFIQARK